MTQAELALRLSSLGWESSLQTSVAALERGRRRITVTDLALLALALEVQPQALLTAPPSARVQVGNQEFTSEAWHALLHVTESDVSTMRTRTGRRTRAALSDRERKRILARLVLGRREQQLMTRKKFPGPTYVSDRSIRLALRIPPWDVLTEIRLRPGVPYVARDRLEAELLKAKEAEGKIRRIDRFEARRLRSSTAERQT